MTAAMCPLGGNHEYSEGVGGICINCFADSPELSGSSAPEDVSDAVRRAIADGFSDGQLMAMPMRKKRTARKARTNPETKIQKEIVAFLRSLGIFVWRNNMAPMPVYGRDGTFVSFRGAPNVGMPDLMAVIPATSSRQAMLLSVEVKTDTGRVSPEQEKWIKKLIDIGTIAIVARSADEVKEALNVNGYLT